MLITKTAGEVAFEIESMTVNNIDEFLADGFAYTEILINIRNFFSVNGSIGVFEYNIGAGWVSATLFQLEDMEGNIIDEDDIPLTSISKQIKVVWDSASDLQVINSFTNLQVKLSFYDQASQAGTISAEVSHTEPTFSQQPDSAINVSAPYPDDPQFDFEFLNLLSIETVWFHFFIEVAASSDPTFSSPLLEYKSEDSQVGWTVNGGAFPVGGAVSDSGYPLKIIKFTNAALTALASSTDYNIRVRRSLHDPLAVLPPFRPWD